MYFWEDVVKLSLETKFREKHYFTTKELKDCYEISTAEPTKYNVHDLCFIHSPVAIDWLEKEQINSVYRIR